MRVQFSKQLYGLGESVKAEVSNVFGEASVESGLSMTSFVIDVPGSVTVALGNINRPCFSFCRIRVGAEIFSTVMVFTPSGNRLELATFELTSKDQQPEAVPVGALTKFRNGFTQVRVNRIFESVMKQWIAVNAVGAPVVVVTCILTPAAAACVLGAVGKAAELYLAFMQAMVAVQYDDGVLTAGERDELKHALGLANFIAQTITLLDLGSARIEKLTTIANATTTLVAESETAKLVVGFGNDLTQKYVVALKALQM